jgi:hypothetical protein
MSRSRSARRHISQGATRRFHALHEFTPVWQYEAEMTQKMLDNITDDFLTKEAALMVAPSGEWRGTSSRPYRR